MQQFMTFVMNHWQLWLAFIVILGLLIGTEIYSHLLGIPQLSPQQTVAMINHQNAIALDIRDKASFAKGHVLGAINIPLPHLNENSAKLEHYKKQTAIIIDELGNTSAKAGNQLRQHGFTQLYSLKGGINAWINANMPLAKK